MDLLVLAKEPVPGRVKTRLTPPCTPDEAAAIARAALADTLVAALACQADRVILGLDRTTGAWCPAEVEVVAQGSGNLATRLETIWAHAHGPAVQIGMDTPQATGQLLDKAFAELQEPGTDAVLGLAADGGWWAIGLVRPVRGCFAGIETSRPDTGARQLERLEQLGLNITLLPELADVDHWNDAVAISQSLPGSAFAKAVKQVADRLQRAGVPTTAVAASGGW